MFAFLATADPAVAVMGVVAALATLLVSTTGVVSSMRLHQGGAR